jgi:beta-glucosidase
MRKLVVAACAACVGSAFCGGSPPPPPTASPDVRADYVVGQMTLDEKIQLVHGGQDLAHALLPRGAAGWIPGIARLGVPDLYFADGSVGVGNDVGPATALPSCIANAASFDLDEAYAYGKVLGAELHAFGMNVSLAGNVNLTGREPRDGRTFETKGEDPILAGRIAAAQLRGIQDQHVIGDIKHFAMNDQETNRTTADSLIDERSARESDLLAFEIGIAGSDVQSVMCSYNLVNDTYGCENQPLLDGVLKGDWQFPGFVMSDWGATHSTVAAAENGLEQEQPSGAYFGASLKDAVEAGDVPESRLDDMVHRILRAMFACGLFDDPAVPGPIDAAGDAAVAQDIEEKGAVLLENDGVLPLSGATLGSIAVIGAHADVGVLSGGGSAQVMPVGGAALTETAPCPPCWAPVVWDPSSPLDAIRAKAPGASVQYADGTDTAAAAALAAASDVAIVFVSQWESEGMDLPSLDLDESPLVAAVAAANPQTVVVLETGGPSLMPWLASVSAVLEAWYPGQRGGEAIADLLFGDANPSGKLPLTFPASVSDLPRPTIPAPTDFLKPFPVDYSIEGFDVGYKWYASRGLTPLFPFGFGLSYTTFAVTNAQLATTPGASPSFEVTFDLRNTGVRAGAEIEQVYLDLPAAAGEARRLVGFARVDLAPGQTQSVAIDVSAADSSHPLSVWDAGAHAWTIPSGPFTVLLGDSSQNVTAVGTFQVP